MSLTINTKPDIFSNAAAWNVETSLTEGASYQNLRIKAAMYAGGGALASKVARVDENKQADFDFSEILRSRCAPMRLGLNDTNSLDTGYGVSAPSNLITGWTNDGTLTWDTLTSTGATLDSLINTGNIAKAYSNNFSVTKGRKYSLSWASLTVNSGIRPRVELEVVTSEGNIYELEEDTDAEVFVFTAPADSAAANVQIWADAADSVNISTWFLTCRLVPAFVDSYELSENYYILFSEMYENASDVTTTGDQDWSNSRMFFAVDPRETFDDYVCDGSAKKLLTLRPAALTYYQNPNGDAFGEVQINFICKINRIYFSVSIDGGGPVIINRYNLIGGAAAILNNQSGFPAAGTEWEIHIENSATTELSASYYWRQSTRAYDSEKMLQLEWANRYGGNESFIFLGGYTETETAERSIYRNASDRKRLASAVTFTRKRLVAPNCTPGEARAIADLIQSKVVYLVEGTGATRTEVYVVNNSLKTYDRGDLVDVDITIEE